MKKNVILFLTMMAVAAFGTAFAGTPVDKSQLPKAAITFLAKHFAGDEIFKVEKDTEYRRLEFDVDLMSGAEVDFRDDGEWKNVKAPRGKAVPETIVPPAITKYVAKNFPEQSITEIARKRGGYEIELSNGLELHLTAEAAPMPARQGGAGHRGRR